MDGLLLILHISSPPVLLLTFLLHCVTVGKVYVGVASDFLQVNPYYE